MANALGGCLLRAGTNGYGDIGLRSQLLRMLQVGHSSDASAEEPNPTPPSRQAGHHPFGFCDGAPGAARSGPALNSFGLRSGGITASGKPASLSFLTNNGQDAIV